MRAFVLLLLLMVVACRADTIRRVWTIPAPNVRALALSPGGETVTVVSDVGHEKLALWKWKTLSNRPLWTRPAPGTNFVTVGPGGEFLLTACRMSPSHPFLSVRQGADGAQVSRPVLDGAVWDMAVSPDGRRAGIVSGGRWLYLLTLDGTFGSRRVPLSGIGTCVAFAPDGGTVTVGMWDAGGAQSFTPGGSPLWRWAEAGVQGVQTAGRFVLGTASGTVRGPGPTLVEWPGRGDGKPLWRYALPPDARDARTLLTENGQMAAVSFLRWPARAAAPQRRLLLLDTADGRKVWDRGSFLFAPVLLAMAADGRRITVSDGRTTLYNLDGAGRVTATYKVGSSLTRTQATPDGRFLLVNTGAEEVSLFALE